MTPTSSAAASSTPEPRSPRWPGRLTGGGLLLMSEALGAGKSSLLRAGLLVALARGAIDGPACWPQLVPSPWRR